jgi:hypothetical protein
MLPPFDKLKEECAKIHYFGLGFIQVKVTPFLRYHFYHFGLPVIMPEEEVHNHRYPFTSFVLKGALNQQIYGLGRGADYVHSYVSCQPNKPAPKSDKGIVAAEVVSNHWYSAGSYYTIRENQYHKVKATYCVTMVQRSTYVPKEFAEVLRKPDAPEVCPFSKVIPESELWELIRTFYT